MSYNTVEATKTSVEQKVTASWSQHSSQMVKELFNNQGSTVDWQEFF